MADNAKAYIGISNQGLEQVNGKKLYIKTAWMGGYCADDYIFADNTDL
ncbi:MAG: hypothetical protein JRE65_11755 [Deltaproteobacteria bacterium]|jgi:hypothetical protein|nr:hypothetical protein [Deltaproteobacteria bacterium]